MTLRCDTCGTYEPSRHFRAGDACNVTDGMGRDCCDGHLIAVPTPAWLELNFTNKATGSHPIRARVGAACRTGGARSL